MIILLKLLLLISIAYGMPYERDLPLQPTDDRRPLGWIPKVQSYPLKYEDEKGIVYDTVVNFNKHGFRITESDKKAGPKSRHLFLIGCSATYGQGLEDEQSFPYLISKKLNDWQVVNLGVRGTAPHDHIYFWRTIDFPKMYPQENGVMIFTLIPDHFERMTRTWRYLHWAYKYSTMYDIENDKVVYKGVVESTWDYKWTRFIGRQKLMFHWLNITDIHSDYIVKGSGPKMARMLLEIKRLYLENYPKGKFVVAWMQEPIRPDEREAIAFKKELDRLGLETWIPETTHPPANDSWTIPRDGHPSAWAANFYSEFLLKSMSQQGWLP